MHSAILLWQIRLSVHHTLELYTQTNSHIVRLFPGSGRSMTRFLTATAVTKVQGELPNRER